MEIRMLPYEPMAGCAEASVVTDPRVWNRHAIPKCLRTPGRQCSHRVVITRSLKGRTHKDGHMKKATRAIVLVTVMFGTGFAQAIKIDLARGSDRERQTKARLEQV